MLCLAVCRVFTGFRIFRGLKVLTQRNTGYTQLNTSYTLTTKHKLHTQEGSFKGRRQSACKKHTTINTSYR